MYLFLKEGLFSLESVVPALECQGLQAHTSTPSLTNDF
jgi:hypothetical protein